MQDDLSLHRVPYQTAGFVIAIAFFFFFVELDLSVNCDELYFTLEATALKISPLKVNVYSALVNCFTLLVSIN